MATKEQNDQRASEYADHFNAPEQAPAEQSEDDAFGLGPETAAPAGEAGEAAEPPAEEAGESPAAEAAEPPAAAADAAAPAADPEQRLKSWEGRLKAKQAELDAREASMGTSNTNEEQGSLPMDGGEESADHEAGESAGVEAAEESDPGKALAEDFGADFVDQITKLVQKMISDGVGGVSSTVDQVIADLQNERQMNHFSAIAETHGDFMDVVESPEFAAWKAAQPDQPALQKVIDAGSAKQIVAMLTAFKQSKSGDMDGADDDALDNAEGVRSGAVTLPKEPSQSQDFADAWNEA